MRHSRAHQHSMHKISFFTLTVFSVGILLPENVSATCSSLQTASAVASCASQSAPLCNSTPACAYGCQGSVTASCNKYSGFATYCSTMSCAERAILSGDCAADAAFEAVFATYSSGNAVCSNITVGSGCADPFSVEVLASAASTYCSQVSEPYLSRLNRSIAFALQLSCAPSLQSVGPMGQFNIIAEMCFNLMAMQIIPCGDHTDCLGAAAIQTIIGLSPWDSDSPNTSRTVGLAAATGILFAIVCALLGLVTRIKCKSPPHPHPILEHSEYVSCMAKRDEGRPISPVSRLDSTPPKQDDAQGIIRQLLSNEWRRGELVGKGRNGRVYRCNLFDGNTVALKQIPMCDKTNSIPEVITRLQVISAHPHKHIVRHYCALYDVHSNEVNIWMEYVSGGSIGAMLRKRSSPSLSEKVVAGYTRQILSAMEFLHGNGIIHGDVKADNVLLDEATGIVKLADFGSAHLELSDSATHNVVGPEENIGGVPIGTALWTAPEVIQSACHNVPSLSLLSETSDIWSVGITVAEMMQRGKLPWPHFENSWQALFHIGRHGAVPEMPVCTQTCASFLAECWQTDPQLRPSAKRLLLHPWLLPEHSSSPRSVKLDDTCSKACSSISLEENEGCISIMPEPAQSSRPLTSLTGNAEVVRSKRLSLVLDLESESSSPS